MTKKEYLEQLEQETGHKASKPNYWKKIMLKRLGVILASAVILTGAAAGMTSHSRESAYDSGELPVWENLSYKDSFQRLNQPPIGNDINALLDGGKILMWDTGKALGFTSVQQGFLQLGTVSYINRLENSYVYRDDQSYHILKFNPENNDRKEIFTGRAGEVFCVGSMVYFVNLDAARNIYVINLNASEDAAPLVKEHILSFAVCNDAIVGLSTDNKLYSWDVNGKGKSTLSSKIEKFFLNGNVIAQTRNKLISFTTNGELPKDLYISEAEDFSLAGVLEENIYIQENGKLLAYKNGEVQEVVGDMHNMYRCLSYDRESGNVYVEAVDNSNGKITETLIVLRKG